MIWSAGIEGGSLLMGDSAKPSAREWRGAALLAAAGAVVEEEPELDGGPMGPCCWAVTELASDTMALQTNSTILSERW